MPGALLSALLIASGVIVAAQVPAPVLAFDFDSLTWSHWEQEYSAAVRAQTLPRLYAIGPRVRAKVFVAEAITLSQLRDGEAIFRQRVSEIVGLETIDRVQIEFIQTDAVNENTTGAYAVSLGISALPLPSTNSTPILSSIKEFIAAVDGERARIIDRLRNGGMVHSQHVTINALHLFGSPMQLLDLALDGETFYQLSLKPWVGVHLALTSTSSPSALSDVFADPFQNLQLRFKLANLLQAARIGTSDVIARRFNGETLESSGDTIVLVPFTAYYAAVVLVQIEIHIESSEFSPIAMGKLLNTTSGSEAGIVLSSPLMDTVSDLDRQLTLLAIDVDPAAGQTTWSSSSTSSASGLTSPSVDSDTYEIGIRVRGIPVPELEQRKWYILRGVWLLLEPLLGSRVRVQFRSLTVLTSTAFNSNIPLTNDWTKPSRSLSGSSFALINARNYDLGLLVKTADARSLDATRLRKFLSAAITSSYSSKTLRDQLLGYSSVGVTPPSDTATVALGDVIDASTATSSTLQASSAFVGVNLTLVADSDFDAGSINIETMSSIGIFQLHAVRSALVLLLQQIGIVDTALSLDSMQLITLPVRTSASTSTQWMPAITLGFYASIEDESQRRGVRRMALSRRFATTIAAYTRNKLAVVVQSVSMHADESLRRPRYLPGSLLPFPIESGSTEFVERPGVLSSSNAKPASFVIYRFQTPSAANSASGIQSNASHQCPASFSTPNVVSVCLKLRIRSDLASRILFLREVSSVQPIRSSSIRLPPFTSISASNWTEVATATGSLSGYDPSSTTIGNVDAPWIAPAKEAATWVFAAELDMSSTQYPSDGVWSMRLAFGAIGNGTSTAPTEAFSLLLALNGTDGELEIRKVDAVEVSARDWEDPSATSPPVDTSSSQVLVSASRPNVSILLSNSTGVSNSVVGPLRTASVKADMDLRVDASLGWGMYAVPPYSTADQLLAASCSACMADSSSFSSCANSPGACAAISECFRSLLDTDPTAISRLLASSEPQASVDASWVLAQCLSPSDGSVWPHSLLPVFNGTFRCLWTNQCPVSTLSAATSHVALHHKPGEQTVRFQPNAEGGSNLTLSFVLDVEGGELDGGSTATLEFADFFTSNNPAAPSELSDQLTSMYRRFSSTALVEVEVQAAATSTVQQIELVLRYYFLGSLMLPYLSVSNSSSSDSTITASVSRASESLELRVVT